MRVAALYDIHGNLPALDAVLAEAADADTILLGGDIATGPMPRATLERLLALGDRLAAIRGNTDRELIDRYDTSKPVPKDDIWAQRAEWAAREITREQRDFLASLPEHVVLDVDGLGPTLFCHGSPRSDEEIVTALTSEDRLREILAGVRERVVVCGHTHVQFDRIVDGTRIVNAGSVGMPYEGRPGAFWALLGPDVELKETPYDAESAANAFRASGFPDADEHAEFVLLSPASPAEASEYFERQATEQKP